MDTTVRHRFSNREKSGILDGLSADEYKHSRSTSVILSEAIWFIILAFIAVLYASICYMNTVLPTPKSVSSAKPGEFIEERARVCLHNIVNLGHRPVGSYANEKLAVDLILKELHDIQSKTKAAHKLEVDLQHTTGTFSLPFLSEFASYYENVNNIIAKFGPKEDSNDSVLVNCHYDSVVDSPGASDDAVSCCVMLEVLLVLSQSDTPLKHNVIFIFNGAEENILQASHGFITQHKWATGIRAFVNLDAAGAGGRELLFRAGPENPWILKLYSDVAPYPSASVFAQEIFDTGLIPSETDYRIYREYGDIAGVDIANVYNGYVYHTIYDTPDKIGPGSIQRAGANLLAFVKALADSPLLPNPGEYRHGGHVFFDIVGICMISYPARMGFILNAIVGLATLFRIARRIAGATKSPGFTGITYLKYLLSAGILHLLVWVVAVVIVMLFAAFVHMIGRPMSWYTNQWVVIGLYVCPAIIVAMMSHGYLRTKIFWSVNNLWDVEACFHDFYSLIVAVLLLFMTWREINSATLLMMILAGPLMFRHLLPNLLNLNLRENPFAFLVLHLASTLLSNLIFLMIIYGLLVTFFPIMGRAGNEVIPDVFISVILVAAVVMVMGHQVGLLYVTKKTTNIINCLALIWFIISTLVILTPVGFPYKYTPEDPRMQRQIAHHLGRTFHNREGEVIKQDAGLWVVPFDAYGMTALQKQVPVLRNAQPTGCDNEGPYCGWPFFFPLLPMMKKNYYLPTAPPILTPPAELSLVDKKYLDDLRIHRFTFQVAGPDHINVMIRPRTGAFLLRWSVGSTPPIPGAPIPEQEGYSYFIFYSYGTKPEKPWTFWLDLQVDQGIDINQGIVDVALGANYIQDDTRFTPELKEYIASMPDWSFSVGWSATYESWVF